MEPVVEEMLESGKRKGWGWPGWVDGQQFAFDMVPVPDTLAGYSGEGMRGGIDRSRLRASLPDLGDHQLADAFVARLRACLRELEASLREDEQLRVSTFVGYRNPDLVALQGVDPASGERATLLVHPEALQLFCSVETLEIGKPRRQIGFRVEP